MILISKSQKFLGKIYSSSPHPLKLFRFPFRSEGVICHTVPLEAYLKNFLRSLVYLYLLVNEMLLNRFKIDKGLLNNNLIFAKTKEVLLFNPRKLTNILTSIPVN